MKQENEPENDKNNGKFKWATCGKVLGRALDKDLYGDWKPSKVEIFLHEYKKTQVIQVYVNDNKRYSVDIDKEGGTESLVANLRTLCNNIERRLHDGIFSKDKQESK